MIDHSQLDPSEKPAIEPSDEAIRLRSQQIWEREGCPEGQSQDHWVRAKAELEAEQEHWVRAKAELDAQMEKTSNPHLPEPIRRKIDFLRSILVQAGTLMPKVSVPAGPRPLPLAPAKRPRQTSTAPSIVSADIVLYGALESTGDIQLDGRVEGNVRSSVLVVGDEGAIQGDVIAEDVTVRGCIRGSIRARELHLCSGARVEGDILYGIFVAEAGAQFVGTCRYAGDPLAQELVPEETVEAETLFEAPRSQNVA